MEALLKSTTRAKNRDRKAKAIPILGGSATETAIEAILDHGRGWTRHEEAAPTYGDPDGTYVSLGDPTGKLKPVQETTAWNTVLALDDATAQTFLFLMARCLAEGPASEIRVHVNDLLAFRGIKRHGDGDYRRAQKVEERERLLLLRQMWVAGRDVVEEKRGNTVRKKRVRLYSPLVEVQIEAEDKPGALELPNLNLTSEVIPYAFRVSLGGWSKTYIGAERYVRELLDRIVQYDPKRTVERIALRVGLHLHFKPATLTSVQQLLDGGKIEIPTRNASRFREAFESALFRLVDDGVLGGWSYAIEDDSLPALGWAQKWLTWNIAIKPPNIALQGLTTSP